MSRIVCWLSLDIPILDRRSRIDGPSAARHVNELGAWIAALVRESGGVAAQDMQIESSALGLFETVCPTIEAAIAIQTRLAEEGCPARLVILVHEQPDRNTVPQSVLSRAERLRGSAPEGAIVADLATVTLCGEEPLDAARWRRLAAADAPEPISALDHPSLPPVVDPPAASHLKNNLPRQFTAFVGRNDDIEGIIERFYLSRLVTVVGPGGIGKTRTAVQVGYELLDRQPDGVWWVDCRSSATSDALAEALLRALPDSRLGEAAPMERLLNTLRHRETLILLDNAESVLDTAAEIIERVGQTCPNVAFLVTSRRPLKVAGESVFRLGPLPATDTRSPAVKLVLDRISLHHPEFEPNPAQLRSILAICRHLDGFPLALELAAAQYPHRALASIERQVRQSMLELKPNLRNGAARTLAAVVSWGYESLRPGDQRLLRCLSVYPDRFTPEMATVLCTSRQPEKILARLEEGSFIQRDDQGYRWLEPIRQFARSELSRSADEAATLDRATRYAIDEVESLYSASRDFAEWVRVCDRLLPFLLEVLDRHLRGPVRDDVPFRIVYGLYDYWYSQGRFAEGETLARRLLAKSAQRPTLEQLRLCNVSGILRMQQGRHRDAAGDLQRALELSKDMGSPVIEAKLMSNYALALCRIPRLAEAIVAVERACDLSADLDDRSTHIANLINGANVHLANRDLPRVREYLERARSFEPAGLLSNNLDLTEASLLCHERQYARAQAMLETVIVTFIREHNARATQASLMRLLPALVHQGLHRQAAAVSGLMGKLRSRFSMWMIPWAVDDYDEALMIAREALGESFEAEAAIGAELTEVEFAEFLEKRGALDVESP
ncbi:MAG: AAA family ATPase [Methanoregulaceae archaeon]|nr:AAA family ATPase [Methanoregulaceae archaeon]